MKTLLKTLIYTFQMICDSIFDNDAHKIVSKQGQKELLIRIMKHDEEAGMYDVDFSEKSKENLE